MNIIFKNIFLEGKLVPGNLHMNMMVSGALEVLAYTVAIFAFLRWAIISVVFGICNFSHPWSYLYLIFLLIVDWVADFLSPLSWPLLAWLSSWQRQPIIKRPRWNIFFFVCYRFFSQARSGNLCWIQYLEFNSIYQYDCELSLYHVIFFDFKGMIFWKTFM